MSKKIKRIIILSLLLFIFIALWVYLNSDKMTNKINSIKNPAVKKAISFLANGGLGWLVIATFTSLIFFIIGIKL